MLIGKLTFFAQPDLINVEKFTRQTGFSGAILQILYRGAILFRIATAGKVQPVKTVLLVQRGEALNQLLLQAVELIAALRQVAGVELILQPDPLEKRRFVQRGWRIGVVLQQLDLACAIPRQIEA